MDDSNLKFANNSVRSLALKWGEHNQIDVIDEICMHFEEVFSTSRIELEQANVTGENLVLIVASDKWAGTREFVFTPTGSMCW